MSFKLAQSSVAALRLLATTAIVALVVACSQLGLSDRFATVTGAGYEGAIVKAADVPSSWRLNDESTWTPSADDVRIMEAELVEYLRRASSAPLEVDPTMIFEPTRPPRNAEELRDVILAPGTYRFYMETFTTLAAGSDYSFASFDGGVALSPCPDCVPPPFVAPVPEPGSIFLLGTGLLAAARAARKRYTKT